MEFAINAETLICDRCRGEFDATGIRRPVMIYLPGIGEGYVERVHVHLCAKCHTELAKLTNDYFMAMDDESGATTMKESPAADIECAEDMADTYAKLAIDLSKRVESLTNEKADDLRVIEDLTDENKLLKSDIEELKRRIKALRVENTDRSIDIEELEEELERLRDVKDELFETNFVLTAKLKELGVEVED